jgi:hypothetical protein
MDSFIEIRASVLARKVGAALAAHLYAPHSRDSAERVRLEKLQHMLSLVGPEATVHLSATDAQTLRYREL